MKNACRRPTDRRSVENPPVFISWVGRGGVCIHPGVGGAAPIAFLRLLFRAFASLFGEGGSFDGFQTRVIGNSLQASPHLLPDAIKRRILRRWRCRPGAENRGQYHEECCGAHAVHSYFPVGTRLGHYRSIPVGTNTPVCPSRRQAALVPFKSCSAGLGRLFGPVPAAFFYHRPALLRLAAPAKRRDLLENPAKDFLGGLFAELTCKQRDRDNQKHL